MSCPSEATGSSCLLVEKSDIFRATLADDCGNLGYLGFAPDGSEYHVVVPVDLKLARGVKALNQPDDGTPFGGYKGWRYFECRPSDASGGLEARWHRVEENAAILRNWLHQFGIDVKIV
ncbi:MAG: hypothetical protein GXO34_01345 [Deltaproteobacteria bacterium]|nr:hypothetical protein [Deltaproteobacteria bacterium]